VRAKNVNLNLNLNLNNSRRHRTAVHSTAIAQHQGTEGQMSNDPRLQVMDGELAGKTLTLASGKHILGRDDDECGIFVPDSSISLQHLELEVRDHQLLIRDLESTNGTVVNDRRVTEAVLNDQDYFAAGSVFFRFESGQELHEIISSFKERVAHIKDEINRKIIGQQEVIDQLLAAVFGGGHCLLVGVPGLAKTEIVKTLAAVLDLDFKRVQFTPDLMPSDITGTNIISMNDDSRQLKFVQGPIFTQFLLADEINRTPPKTQAALLEAMQEHQVTVGIETFELPRPFFVVATQNPIEQEGTYPLPEAQLDRFMFNIHVDYPTLSEEEEILRRTTRREPVAVGKAMKGREIMRFQKAIQQVEVAPYVISFVTKIVRSTRPRDEEALPQITETLDWGAGPRAGQYLIWGAKAMAAMDGRLSVSCEDVRRCAVPVLRHRMTANFQAQASGLTTVDIVNSILDLVPEPEVAKYL
jgi:MoxR-like ATPase